mgnify:CR=1 FL=1
MKVAPIIHEIRKRKAEGVDIEYSLVHTGQHYDKKMSGDFFDQLNIPKPDANLSAGGGTQAEQTGAIMIRFEEYLMKNPTDLVLVVGDVTSTMACTIVAKKAGIKKFIYASSSSVYGISNQKNVTEDHPLVPLTLYNKYKGLCEPILEKYTDETFTGVYSI